VFYNVSMAKKYIKGLPSFSFNNLVIKKLKTYISHSQLPRRRYNGTKKEKKVWENEQRGWKEKQVCVYEKKK
jgi:hypothetical protein